MKEPASERKSGLSPLTHLAAFTLGVICLAVVLLAVRRDRGGPGPEPLPSEAPPQVEPIPKRRFEKSSRPGDLPHSKDGSEIPAAADPAPAEAGAATENSARQTPALPMPNVRGPALAVFERGHERSRPGGASQTRMTGTIKLHGEAPPEKLLPMDPQCAAKHAKPPTTRFYVTGKDGALADVVVEVRNAPKKRAADAKPHVLTLSGCLYDRYVSAVMTGQKVSVRNRDQTVHNLHLSSDANGDFNKAILPGSADTVFSISQPESFVRLKCDVHPWEFAYVSVFDHPYFAVSDANGHYQIPSLPPGDYEIVATHRKSGEQRKTISVEAHRETRVDFEFDVRPDLIGGTQ